MKRILAALLILALLSGSCALALTGEEVLGLGSSGSSGSGYSGYPTLSVGSRDGDDSAAYVVALQNRLQELGYLASAADGQFGAMTETAVFRFQEVNGLTPTGIADDSTQSYLYSAEAKVAPVSEIADSEALRVQQKMMLWGFMYGYADGIAGETTKTAVAEFKDYIYTTCSAAYAAYATPAPTPMPTLDPNTQPVAMDLPKGQVSVEVNGFDGEITEDVMRYVNGEYIFQLYQRDVNKGDEDAEVWRVQRRLRQLGYLYKPDGEFGSLTERALKYFQKKHGLKQTGIADEATQTILFSPEAAKSEEYIFPYKIGVDIGRQRVYVYEWDGSDYEEQIMRFKCSTGLPGYDTPVGTYQAGGKVTFDEWYYFAEYNCYAKYAYRIVGGIMFHSVLYNSSKQGPTNSSVNALGKKASHGCIRLSVDNAQWIAENCPEGTTVVIK